MTRVSIGATSLACWFAFCTPGALEALPLPVDFPACEVCGVAGAFFETLSDDDVSSGRCVANATVLASRLEAAGVPTDETRITLLVRPPEPFQAMPVPLFPQPSFARGLSRQGWIWHAWVVSRGWALDPNSRPVASPLAQYYQSMWEPTLGEHWLFSLPAARLPEIVGSAYPGARPRMYDFEPMNFRTFLADWRRVSRRRLVP